MKHSFGYLLWFLLATFAGAPAEQSISNLSTDASAAQRFVSVHGQRAVLMGYSEHGLEAWAYPFQIFSGYRVGFQSQGATSETDGRMLLRRVIYSPDSITRVYIGPNYIVYGFTSTSRRRSSATVKPQQSTSWFTAPVLNLMWPWSSGRTV